jgi:hypothetical protein
MQTFPEVYNLRRVIPGLLIIIGRLCKEESNMSRFLNEKQRSEINETLEKLGIEYGIPLKRYDNILLAGETMAIIYKHESAGLCKSEITTDYLADNDREMLEKAMRAAVIKLREQLETGAMSIPQ